MSENMSELVDEPKLIDADDDVSLDRWQKYGHDRLYINGARVEPYIDLETGELGDTGMVLVQAEFDGDVVTVEIGHEDGHDPHDIIVISLSGDMPDDEEDEETEETEESATESDEDDDEDEPEEEQTNAETLEDVEEGDIIEQLEGQKEGARYRVVDLFHNPWGDEELMSIDVEPLPGEPHRRQVSIRNGPLCQIVEKAEENGANDEKRIMTDGGSTHPREVVDCPECGAAPETWEEKRRLPQIEQTYQCVECGHEVFVYDASDLNERPLLRFRPVTDGMAMNLRFFGEIGDWPDSALEDLYKRGLERVEAIDYRIVEREGLSQSEWARRTERSQQTVSEAVQKARVKLDE